MLETPTTESELCPKCGSYWLCEHKYQPAPIGTRTGLDYADWLRIERLRDEARPAWKRGRTDAPPSQQD